MWIVVLQDPDLRVPRPLADHILAVDDRLHRHWMNHHLVSNQWLVLAQVFLLFDVDEAVSTVWAACLIFQI